MRERHVISRDDIDVFENARPMLRGLAYRMLGSMADAEDAVQDTFVRWAAAEHETIEHASAWLKTVCARRCLDVLKAAERKRVQYVGAWLPEPVQASSESGDEHASDIAASLRTAFLLTLDRLAPKERAAYLLHVIFDEPYSSVAETLGVSEPACRKLVSRARANVDAARVRHTTPAARQEQLLDAFQEAIRSGEPTRLATMLSEDIRLTADGGGKVPTIRKVLRGPSEVLGFLAEQLHVFWAEHDWRSATLNGALGVVLERDGVPVAAVSFCIDEAGRLADIFIVRNPEKLQHLQLIELA